MNRVITNALELAQFDLYQAGKPFKYAQEAVNGLSKKLEAFPADIAIRLIDYWKGRILGGECERNANLGIADRIKDVQPAMDSTRLDWEYIRNEGKAERFAKSFAKHNYAMVQEHSEQGPVGVYHLLAKNAEQQGFTAPYVPDDRPEDTPEQKAANELARYGAIARMCDPDWCCNRINTIRLRVKEHLRIAFGDVRPKTSPYVSRECLTDYRGRKQAGLDWLMAMEVVNDEGLSISLADAFNASVSNPDNRRRELMTRIRGIEDLANDNGLKAYFVTLTAPSAYHKRKNNGRHHNPAWSGATPKETQQYLCQLWARVRSAWDYRGIRACGIRVAEPHSDGTPHWHLLLWFDPKQAEQAIDIFCDRATEEGKAELESGFDKRQKAGRTRPGEKWHSVRFDAEYIDPAKGSATGYIAKYLSKNINGKQFIDYDHEAETTAETGAERVQAWANTWGIRQFQFIGGAPVTVWRECRRLDGDQGNAEFDAIRGRADAGDWAGFVSAMGGLFAGRNEQKAGIEYEETENQYGETVKKIKGVTVAGFTAVSRLCVWAFRKRGEASQEAGGLPWSSDNNCIGQDLDPIPTNKTPPDLSDWRGIYPTLEGLE